MSETITYCADPGETIGIFARRLSAIRELTRAGEVRGGFNGIPLIATPHHSEHEIIRRYSELLDVRRNALDKLSPEEREVLGL